MNKLSLTKTYLAGNLEYISAKDAHAWRDDFKLFCNALGIVCMSPLEQVFANFPVESPESQASLKGSVRAGRLLRVHNKMKEIRRRDLSMVDHSTFVVAVINTTKPTFGTVEELVVAEKSNKPVFIVVSPSTKETPLWLLGMFKPYCFYNSIEEVKIAIKKLDSGRTRMDRKHWKIFSNKYQARQ